METALDSYKRIVSEQPALDDASFAETMARAQAGDEAVRRQIAGSCLAVALTAAEDRWNHDTEDDLFDLIQDANSALVDALATFAGSYADEFLRHARQTIPRRLSPQS